MIFCAYAWFVKTVGSLEPSSYIMAKLSLYGKCTDVVERGDGGGRTA
jgi:hypothetical protein